MRGEQRVVPSVSRLRERAAHYRRMAALAPEGSEKRAGYLEIATLLDHEAEALNAELSRPKRSR